MSNHATKIIKAHNTYSTLKCLMVYTNTHVIKVFDALALSVDGDAYRWPSDTLKLTSQIRSKAVVSSK